MVAFVGNISPTNWEKDVEEHSKNIGVLSEIDQNMCNAYKASVPCSNVTEESYSTTLSEQNGLEDLHTVSKPHHLLSPTAAEESFKQTAKVFSPADESVEIAGYDRTCYSSIFRVPKELRMDGVAYDPVTVSIGPYHRYRRDLDITVEKKEWCVKSVISHRPNSHREDYDKAIKKMEPEIRNCYEETINLTSVEFVSMIVLDCCFILELLSEEESNMNFYSSKWMVPKILRDLVLLENQVPFFALDRLFQLSKPPTQTLSLTELIIKIFSPKLPTVQLAEVHCILKGKHVLDVLRNHLVEPFGIDQTSVDIEKVQNLVYWIPCATDLKIGGVKVKAKSTNNGLLNITFQQGLLEVPPFDNRNGYTWTVLFPNMIAFEQCRRDYPDKITSYVILMNTLIKSKEDVDLLRDEEVINGLDGEEDMVTSTIRKLCQQIHVETFCYDELFRQVNTYRKLALIRWIANLALEYISTPAGVLAAVGSIMVLGLAILRTAFSAK